MNSTMLQDTAVPVIDAVRDASKAVGSMIQTPVQKLHVPHAPALPTVHMPTVHLPTVHLPTVHLRKARRRRKSMRNLAIIGGVGLVVLLVAMLRKRQPDPID